MSEIPALSLHADAAPGRFAEAVTRAERDKERILLTRDGRPVAALVPIEDVVELEASDDARDSEAGRAALAMWDAEGRPAGIPIEDIARELDIALPAEPDAAA